MYWSKNNWRLPALSRSVPMSLSRANKGASASKYSRPSMSLGCKSRRRRLAIFASLPSRQSPGTHEGIAQISCQRRAQILCRTLLYPLPQGSDFLGSVYLTLTEAVVDLKPVEPRDARVDVLGPQLGWQVLIVLSELISIRSVVVRHEDSVPVDPHVPLQFPEVRRGHVLRVPTRRGWSKPLAKPIDRRLSDQPHRHLAITNVEIACPCTIPTQCLVSIEEFLHMPSLGEFSGQLLNLVAIAGREECVEAVFLRPFPLPLDVLVERPGVAVLRRVCQLRGRIARPPRLEHLWRQCPQLGTQDRSVQHRYQKVEFRLGLDLIQKLDGEVFRIGQDQYFARLGIEDITGQFQQFLGRSRGRACRCARGETDRLAGIDIQREKSLSGLDGP